MCPRGRPWPLEPPRGHSLKSLASSILVLGLKSVCLRKGCLWPWPWIFLCPWPWPRTLCPRLHLCLLACRIVFIFQMKKGSKELTD